MVHRHAEHAAPANGSRNGIVCVEWSEPVVADWLMRQARKPADPTRVGGPFVYLIRHDGAPAYVGCTFDSVGMRLRQHRAMGKSIGMLLRRGADGVDVCWIHGNHGVEAHVIRALRPALNGISPRWWTAPSGRLHETPSYMLARAAA